LKLHLILLISLIQGLPLGLNEERVNSLPSNFVSKIQKLESQKLSYVVRRVMKDNDVDMEYAQSARISFLRWASLKFLTNESLVPNLKTDSFWHAFLMFTRDYRDWCNEHFGEMIDHIPEDEGDEVEGPENIEINNNNEVFEPINDGWVLSTTLMRETYGEDWEAEEEESESAGCGHCGSNTGSHKGAECCSHSKGSKKSACGSKCGSNEKNQDVAHADQMIRSYQKRKKLNVALNAKDPKNQPVDLNADQTKKKIRMWLMRIK